ncbi:MAG: TetR/AcrR family transcriptional regulator [Polyangiaceae bacterium]
MGERGPKPKAKPRQERSQETVDAIFEAVSRLLETKKIEDLSGTDICRTAGVSPGTLYQYFRSVDDLVGAWESREVTRSTARLTDLIVSMNAEGARARAENRPPPKTLAENVATITRLGLEIVRGYLVHYRRPSEARLLQRVDERTESIEACSRLLAAALAAHPRQEEVARGNIAVVSKVAVTAVTMCAYETAHSGPESTEYDAEVARMIARYLCRVSDT